MQAICSKTTLLFLLIYGLSNLFCINHSYADTRYVSDTLVVSIRGGQNDDDKIIGYIKTGTSVDILEETDTHLKVRTSDGLEGWVKKQYIVDEKPKAVIINELEARLKVLQDQIDEMNRHKADSSDQFQQAKNDLEQHIQDLQAQIEDQTKNYQALEKQKDDIDAKYKNFIKKSGDTAKLYREIEMLKQKNDQLNTELKSLRPIGKDFLDSIYIKWFLAGFGVLVVGILLGASSRKKKSYYL